MKVQKDAVVAIDYTLRDEQGEVLDESGDAPLHYLHGHGNIVPGLEQALEGLEAGGSTRTTVAPADGYGERDDGRMMTVPRGDLPDEIEPQVGMVLSGQTPDGHAVPLWITELKDQAVVLDGNHPLAGRALDFEVEIKSVRAATDEEKAHGHVHGPGGHAH